MVRSLEFRKGRLKYSAAFLCALLLGAVATTGSSAVPEQNTAETTFNFDTGNAATEVIFPRTEEPLRRLISPGGGDATLILRVAAEVEASWFDAIAPYHPTAVGIYSDLGRRPASEATTNKNKNIAILYATYQVLTNLEPKATPEWRAMLTSVGMDPDDSQVNKVTPIGIGNLAGKSVVAARSHDGMNQLGDEGGRLFNRQPYADYTGYKPVNTPYKLSNPSRWQPDIVTSGNGIFQAQQFVTPQIRYTKPFTYDSPAQFPSPPPVNSDIRNFSAYKKQADEVLAASAALNDVSKMKVEFFADKFLGLGRGTLAGLDGLHLSLDDFIFRFAAVNVGGFETLIAIWDAKYQYDSVRPFSAIKYLYGDKKVTAWGGPGKGTVSNLPGSQWKSYVQAPDHPEYPSGSTSLCATLAQIGRDFNGTDKVDISFTYPKGSSTVEPGLVPAADTTLHWDTFTGYVNDCAQSRIDAGVHFRAAVEDGNKIGTAIGHHVYEFFQAHINGTAPAQG